jgi:nucleotide-binding universal stress UspA family protein
MSTTPRSDPAVADTSGPDLRPVVAGVDSSSANAGAVDWAAREAAARHARLTLVHTWEWAGVPAWGTDYDLTTKKELEREGSRILARAKERAVAAGAPEVRIEIRRGHAPDVLIDLTADAALLVVGSRHPSALARGVFGAVSTSVVSESKCPVVVLSGPPGMLAERPQVVVGLAGVAHDEDLLGFGFDYARRHALPLRAIFCWNPMFGDLRLPPPDIAKLRLAESIAGWREQFPEVETHLVARRGDPVDVLVNTSASQALVVVGRRSQRMRFGAVLGSTSLGVVHHATCPVAVIPPTPRG